MTAPSPPRRDQALALSTAFLSLFSIVGPIQFHFIGSLLGEYCSIRTEIEQVFRSTISVPTVNKFVVSPRC